ncbi:MAG TPA: HEAT repeat domain-containing protein [Acidimicrobiales bacterium]|nr:HEAT repeat domain-containing protein [Acidimicrobiales bacterium]
MSDTGGPPAHALSRPLSQAIAADALDCPVDGLPPLGADDVADLKRILRGETTPAVPIDRARAIRALFRSDRSGETSDVLGRVLANQEETTRARAVAAYGLGTIPGAESERALVRNLSTEDDTVRSEVVTALGRVGSAEALDRLKAVPDPRSPRARRQLSLSRLVIALRAGAGAQEIEEARRALRVGMREPVAPEPDAPQRTFESTLIEAPEVRELLGMVDGSMYGISLSDEVGFRVPCGRATYVLFLNSLLKRGRFVEGVRSKGLVAGILGAQERVTRRVTPRYLVLSTPTPKGLDLLVTRTDGEPAFSGEAALEGDGLRLTLGTAGERGAPARVDGTLSGSDLRWRLVVSGEARQKGHGREIRA